MASSRFDSTDLARTEEFLSRAYSRIHIDARGERTRTRIAREEAPSVTIDSVTFDFDVTYESADPLGRVCVCIVGDGVMERRFEPHRTEGAFGPGEAFLYAPHDRVFGGRNFRARHTTAMLDPQLLGRVAAVDPAAGWATVRFTGDRPVTPTAARQLHRVIVHARDDVLADPFAVRAPLVVSAAAQLLAASVLTTFPHEVLGAGRAGPDRAALPAALRRAVGYIDAHATEPITLADITAAAGTTGRALQLAFRRHYDTTPLGYLRRVRLDGAHRDLLQADPTQGATVADIAARWGFAPAGRFAAFYRAEYGVPPGHTLRS